MASTSSSSSSSNFLHSASSYDGSLVAIVAPTPGTGGSSSRRHLIQIYQVSDSSTSLQLTLTYTTSLPLIKLIFVGTTTMLGLFGQKQVNVWDLHRGVIATKITTSEDDDEQQTFLDIASTTGIDHNNDDNDTDAKELDQSYHVLTRNGPKLYIYEYQLSTNKLVCKIKSGRWMGPDIVLNNDDDDSSRTQLAALVVTPSHFLVRTLESGIRVMDKELGKRTGKIKLDTTSGSNDSASCRMTPCVGRYDILAVVQDLGAIFFYDLNTCNEMTRISAQKVVNDTVSNLQLVSSEETEENLSLLLNDTLYNVKIGNTSSSSSSQQYAKMTQFSSENPIALFLGRNKLLALIHQQASECHGQWIHYVSDMKNDKLPDIYNLGQQQKDVNEDANQDASSANDTKKRRLTDVKVLGPGQAGNETLTATKKLKFDNDEGDVSNNEDEDDDGDDVEENVDDDDNNDDPTSHMTIAERLQMLKEALEEEDEEKDASGDNMDEDDEEAVDIVIKDKTTITFKARTATTESLKELLTQALQSSDDNLLELALTVRDTTIIATTLREIDGELLVILLGKLTSRLASTPLRAEALSVWISHCLKRGTFDPKHLAVLRNLLYERIESFSDLLRLEGRLSMMVD